VWSEALDGTSIAADGSDFTIAGLTVSGATLQAGDVTVRLTTSAQTPSTSYTVECLAGNVLDLAATPNTLTSANFTGFVPVDTTPPTDPTNVEATGGAASPTIASLTWTASTDNVGVTGYRIYRATTATGTYNEIGTSAATSYSDTSGVPGQDYWYKVSAYDAANNESGLTAATGTPVTATWTEPPHGGYTNDTDLCKMCHVPHQAASATNILRETGEAYAYTGVCYACHDGSGADKNLKTGTENSFASAPIMKSGHLLLNDDASADLTDYCSSCHDPHITPLAPGDFLPKDTINGKTAGLSDNTWCFACHDDANSW
jgi:predicted CXXCH cytochrome family protein